MGSRGMGVAAASARLRLDVVREAVEDRLPAVTLLLDRMRRLGVESLAHEDAVCGGDELDPHRAIAERRLDHLVLDDAGVGAREIEAHAAVARFHARGERAAGA